MVTSGVDDAESEADLGLDGDGWGVSVLLSNILANLADSRPLREGRDIFESIGAYLDILSQIVGYCFVTDRRCFSSRRRWSE